MIDAAKWSGSSLSTECTLHQLAPYIGKLKSKIVRHLVESYTKPKDTILDPFSGAGTVALESLLLGRNAIANDINPYAVTLINAKMNPPDSLIEAKEKAINYLKRSKKASKNCSLDEVPLWVQDFFHPNTLKEIIELSNLLKINNEYFLLACLLGILHHQRTGFLSYPSSHLVPYLRTKKFPKNEFSDLYKYREVQPRFLNKIERAYKRFPFFDPSLSKVCLESDATEISLPDNSIDSIITSPPYMNALDYGRDNRLRLWCVGLEDYQKLDKKNPSSIEEFQKLMINTMKNLGPSLKANGYCIFILGEVKTHTKSIDTGLIFEDIILNKVENFKLIATFDDEIPEMRRTRKNGNTTKKESIIVSQKVED
jgi:hypothetical protein